MAASPERHLAWDACTNVRDIGGYATGDGQQTRWGAVVRADCPASLTPAGRAALRDYGVRTVIDLRYGEEIVIAPNPFATKEAFPPGILYHNLPFRDDAERDAAGGGSMSDHYCALLEKCRPRVAAILTAVADAPPGGVLVHCHAGKDRTGLIVALLLGLAGVPAATIIEDYALSAARLRAMLDGRLRALADPKRRAHLARWYAAPETMRRVLRHLDTRHGGIPAYLESTGLSSEYRARLRRRLVRE